MSYRQALLNMGPVGYWRLGEAAGPLLADQLGLRPATAGNGPTFGVAGALADDTDTALTLTAGASQYIAVAPDAALRVPKLSAVCWYKSNTAGQYHDLMVEAEADGFILRINGATNLLEWLIDLGSGYQGIGGPNILDNAWHFVVATWDGTTQRLYSDGVQVGSATPAGSNVAYDANPTLFLGAKNDEFSTGSIDEVALFSRALTSTEVTLLYQVGSLPLHGIASTMTALAAATGLGRTYDWPTDSVNPPCAVVSYPELDPNIIFTGGKVENVYPVFVLVGTAGDKSARTLISGYVHTIPPLLNAVVGGGVDYVNVETVTLREVAVAGSKYLGAVFSCRVMEAL